MKLMEMEEGIEAEFFQMLGIWDLRCSKRESGFLSLFPCAIFKWRKDGGRRNSSPGCRRRKVDVPRHGPEGSEVSYFCDPNIGPFLFTEMTTMFCGL